MGNNKRICSGDDFSDTYTCDLEFRVNNSNGFLPPSPPDSPVLNLDSTHAAAPAAAAAAAAAFDETPPLSKARKKRKATLSPSYAPDSKRLWSKHDELVILKGIVDYRNKTGMDYLSDSAAFFEYIKDSIDGVVSKDQLINKIRKLKSKFRDTLVKKPSVSESFDLSMAIWGKDQSGCVDGSSDRARRTRRKVQAFVEHEVVTNGEPGNDHGLAEGDSFDKNADKNTEKENGGKGSEEDGPVTNGEPEYDDGYAKGGSCDNKLPSENVDKRVEKENGEEDGAADDELSALQDALETTMFQHLGNYAQKQMLQKLKILKAKERKELSGEWKSLLVQEALLKSKKYSFTAKLANAAFHS